MIRINNTQYFHFLQQADVLRHSGALCDTIISVKSETFRAHRLVLACASRRLAQRLALGDADGPAPCKLDYFSPRTFQQVLDFIYTQTLEVPPEDLHQLLTAAQLLEMQPLEDQCRQHLADFHNRAREEDRYGDPVQVKKEKDGTEEESPAQEEELRGNSLQPDEACSSVAMGNASPCGPAKDPLISPASARKKESRKKPRLSPVSAAPYYRESVLTRPVSSSSSFPSPWAVPCMWPSVSTLRRITENFTHLVAAHPLQPPGQSSVAYPFPLPHPHMWPLLGPQFQSSVTSYSGFHPGNAQRLCVGSAGMGRIIKPGLLKRKRKGQRPVNETSGQRYHNVPQTSTESIKERHTSTSLLDDPALQESASTPSGEECAGCQFSGRGDAQQKPKSHQQAPRGEKPYQCQHCPKTFSLKHQLDTHHRVHTGEKPFECRLCGQRSRDYSAMIKHLRTHGGAAPYQCTVCLEFCSSLVAMQRHIKSHALQDFPPDWSISSTYLYNSHI